MRRTQLLRGQRRTAITARDRYRATPRAETSPLPHWRRHRTPTPRAIQQQEDDLTTAALGSLSGLFIGVFSNG